MDTEFIRHVDFSDPIFKNFVAENGNAILDPEKGMKPLEQGASTQIRAAEFIPKAAKSRKSPESITERLSQTKSRPEKA